MQSQIKIGLLCVAGFAFATVSSFGLVHASEPEANFTCWDGVTKVSDLAYCPPKRLGCEGPFAQFNEPFKNLYVVNRATNLVESTKVTVYNPESNYKRIHFDNIIFSETDSFLFDGDRKLTLSRDNQNNIYLKDTDGVRDLYLECMFQNVFDHVSSDASQGSSDVEWTCKRP